MPKTPLLTVDTIIELVGVDDPGVVLVARRHSPLGWALPGGFVDRGESCPAAAVREAREETGLEVTLRALLGVYSDPGRDPRGHTASVVYVGQAEGEPIGGDDAAQARYFSLSALPPLAFDHGRILEHYRRYYRCGRPAPLV